MRNRKPEGPSDVEKFFEFARRREMRAALKPMNYAFEPARHPDMILPERPRADISAAEAAAREIRDYAAKARELYRERRHGERPLEARDYVRHQLALGMIETPMRRAGRVDVQLARAPERAEAPKEARARFRFWRRRRTTD